MKRYVLIAYIAIIIAPMAIASQDYDPKLFYVLLPMVQRDVCESKYPGVITDSEPAYLSWRKKVIAETSLDPEEHRDTEIYEAVNSEVTKDFLRMGKLQLEISCKVSVPLMFKGKELAPAYMISTPDQGWDYLVKSLGDKDRVATISIMAMSEKELWYDQLDRYSDEIMVKLSRKLAKPDKYTISGNTAWGYYINNISGRKYCTKMQYISNTRQEGWRITDMRADCIQLQELYSATPNKRLQIDAAPPRD